MCPCVSQYTFSSVDRSIWVKTKNIGYKRAKKKVLRKTCGPRKDGVHNVG
jgi:hypothetical protein